MPKYRATPIPLAPLEKSTATCTSAYIDRLWQSNMPCLSVPAFSTYSVARSITLLSACCTLLVLLNWKKKIQNCFHYFWFLSKIYKFYGFNQERGRKWDTRYLDREHSEEEQNVFDGWLILFTKIAKEHMNVARLAKKKAVEINSYRQKFWCLTPYLQDIVFECRPYGFRISGH